MTELNQETLFGRKIIKSISYKEQEIIRDILHLHCDGKPIECDPTYSIGNFYKKGIEPPMHKFDIKPQAEGVVEASSTCMPLEDNSINVLMFDPPFVIGSTQQSAESSVEGSCIIQKRFSGFKDFNELKKMYSESLKEFYRVLSPKGVLIFKCQDCVSSAKQYFTHCWVHSEATEIGFYPKDLFILLAKNRLTDKRKQQHARKYHSYFWVFKKLK